MSKPRYRVTIDVFYSQEDEGWIAAIAYPDGAMKRKALPIPDEAMFHLGRVLQLAFDPGDNDAEEIEEHIEATREECGKCRWWKRLGKIRICQSWGYGYYTGRPTESIDSCPQFERR